MSLTDMVSGFDGGSTLIEAWLRNKNTVEFLGIWEKLNNPNFNSLEFDGIKSQAGLNRFTLSVKMWGQRTNGIRMLILLVHDGLRLMHPTSLKMG
ncbi:KilA-N domain-containing protein [Thioflexithrix psekupsensis]|uniref:KilA-N domain-containing protein n=1 Tax=Thioflexithrix psekupsensis TaxID=1570016 RepID=UPI0024780EAB|nr:KilA-N domain-containing protein [Thioflexithrix psekupsensis]